jgi:hypothetical protein
MREVEYPEGHHSESPRRKPGPMNTGVTERATAHPPGFHTSVFMGPGFRRDDSAGRGSA